MKYILIITFFLTSGMIRLGAQEHSHSHDEETTENNAPGVFAVYAESQRYELTLKHEEIKPASEGDLTLYIADYITNEPVVGVELKIAVQEDPSIAVESSEVEPGIFHLHATFPKAASYSFAVNLNSKERGPDLILLKQVEIGKAPPTEESEVHVETHTHSSWWKYALVFLGGLGIGYIFLRTRPKVAASILIVIFCHSMIQEVVAHGGHEEKKTSAGSSVLIPKATQFLFEIRTQQINSGNFQPSVQFYGTVVPSPSGYANITTPQSGKVTALRVTPGQQVTAGQVLAEMQPSVSQSEQVGVASEKGRLNAEMQTARAEMNAAERELNRLRAIEDIVAKKDIQAAEARYNAAKANYDALRNVTSGSAISSGGKLVFKAPVSGTIGQFVLAPGAEVISGTTLFSITNLDKVYVEAQVYDRDSDVVSNASKYTVTCTNDEHKTVQVKIVSAALEVNPTNQSQKVLFEVLNPDGEFKIGEFVTLQAFQQGTDKTVFVPNSALSEINGKPVLFFKKSPEMYEVRYISLGEDNGTHSIVLKGMEEG
ncbi:MAG TPA: efflux RND transporter periplasmic adaptor subunit, partial [Saprospiraceae bacterium]|nr:efflux RND transporter periplasmic adaptor subunit [Saprospiraceae bacterium]